MITYLKISNIVIKKCVLNKIKFHINLKNIISLIIVEDYVNNLNN